MFCSKTPEWSKIQKDKYRVLFPDALNSNKEIISSFLSFHCNVWHQTSQWVRNLNSNFVSSLVFLPRFLFHSSFISLHLLVFFSTYCLFSILSTHSSCYLLHLVSVYLSPQHRYASCVAPSVATLLLITTEIIFWPKYMMHISPVGDKEKM